MAENTDIQSLKLGSGCRSVLANVLSIFQALDSMPNPTATIAPPCHQKKSNQRALFESSAIF
jgi:hypothetical protein